MIASRAATDGDYAFASAYEALRSHVLAGAGQGSPFGLILLLREGIAAWMNRVSARCLSAASAHPGRPGATPLVLGELYAGMARVLASMALAGRGERSP